MAILRPDRDSAIMRDFSSTFLYHLVEANEKVGKYG
jgi:hypothetical protein